MILAFALAHGHPVRVHECLDIYAFQAAHPSAIVRPFNEVPQTILAWGLLLLSNAGTLAPPAINQPHPAVTLAPLVGDQQFVLHTAPLSSVEVCTPSDTSRALLTYQSGAGMATRGGDPPLPQGLFSSCWRPGSPSRAFSSCRAGHPSCLSSSCSAYVRPSLS